MSKLKKLTFPLPHPEKEGFNETFNFTIKPRKEEYHAFCNEENKMSKSDYVLTLKRLKEIVNTRKLAGYDDNSLLGDKSTECTWGLCSSQPELWPDPRLHIWPYSFLNRGRVAPIDLPSFDCKCPFDPREENDGQGCFWKCEFFRGKKRPSKKDHIHAINELIEKHEQSIPNQG